MRLRDQAVKKHKLNIAERCQNKATFMADSAWHNGLREL